MMAGANHEELKVSKALSRAFSSLDIVDIANPIHRNEFLSVD